MGRPSARSTEVPLIRYNAKRDCKITSEAAGFVNRTRRKAKPLSFVIQKHWASRLHYDFRLELDGVMLSWAVQSQAPVDVNAEPHLHSLCCDVAMRAMA
jgi:hypothetical protein